MVMAVLTASKDLVDKVVSKVMVMKGGLKVVNIKVMVTRSTGIEIMVTMAMINILVNKEGSRVDQVRMESGKARRQLWIQSG